MSDKAIEKNEKLGRREKKKALKHERIKAIMAFEGAPSLFDIGKRLKELGLITHARSIYKIVQKDEQLQQDIKDIRLQNADRLSRNIVPLALRETERALKDKKTTREEKFKFIKLSLDSEFRQDERKRPVIVKKVNLKAIQQLIYNQMTAGDKEENEVTVELHDVTDTQE